MSREEKDLAERIEGYFFAAWEDKREKGLFDLWEKVESYWEGEPRNPDGPNDPNSNVNFIHANVEGQVAMLMEQNVGITVSPVGPSDVPYARVVQSILEWVKEKNKIKRKLDIHERRREKFGTGIFRVLFDPDALGGFGLPVIEPCNPAYVFIDPNVNDIYKVNEGAFVIETLNKPISWARERFGPEKAGVIKAGFHPAKGVLMNGAFNTDGGNYMHIMAWLRENGVLRLVQMSGCGVILEDSFEDGRESFYANGRYPYFFTPLYSREGCVWAKGDAELLLSLQDLVDDLDDQIRINARLSGNPQRLVDVGCNIELDKWTNESGLIIPTSNINGVKYLVPPEMPDYPMKRRETALNYERQMLTRFSDQMIGQKMTGIRTATELKSLQAQGDLIIGHKKILLQETLAEIFEYCLELIKEYYTEERPFKVKGFGKMEEFVWFRGSDLRKVPSLVPSASAGAEDGDEIRYVESGGTREAAFDIIVSVGSGTPNNREFFFGVMNNALKEGAVSAEEYRK